MTIGQIIQRRVDALSRDKQKKVLSLVRKLAGTNGQHKRNGKPAARRLHEESYIPKDPALRAFAGIWKDRTDLPKDSVEAVKVIRARMRSRGRRHV